MVWLVALIKSFRINPVLITQHGVRVRTGMIVDEFIPFGVISGTAATFDTDRLKSKRTLNLAVMSSPNVCLELSTPLIRTTFLGAKQEIDGVALRLDQAESFHASLARHLE